MTNLVPVNEFKDWDYANPSTLTCANHPDLRWYWKGPGRNLHFSHTSAASNDYRECPCPFTDLRVITDA